MAVNAGSNEMSMFAVDGTHLRLIDKKPSGGTLPVSVAVLPEAEDVDVQIDEKDLKTLERELEANALG